MSRSPERRKPARWLRLLLRAYPDRHRELFAEEIVATAEEVLERCPAPLRALCALRVTFDLLRSALLVRRDHAAKRPHRRPHPSRRKGRAMNGLLGDLKSALLSLRRSPGFTATAVLMMGLAIAATTATYSLVDAILLRPLPFEEPERLVQLWESNPDKGWETQTAAPANVLDWRERVESFEDVGWYLHFQGGSVTLTGEGDPVALSAAFTSGNFFSVLGVQPALGRFFTWDETWDGGDDPVVLSHALWRNRFDGDPEIVGRSLTIEGSPVTVVGIAPRGFRMHDAQADVWSPMDWDPQARDQAWFRRAHFLRPIARLAPGVDAETARAELEAVAARLQEEHPALNENMGAGLTPLHQWVVDDARRALWILLGAVLSVLLVACVNLAHLLLARSSERRDELETRRAIGASGLRLLMPAILESVLLGAAAGVGGVGGAYGLVSLARTYGPSDIPRLWEAGVDLRALSVGLALGLLTALLCTAAPARAALRATRMSSHTASRVGAGRREHRTHRLLVAAEVALAMVLVVFAGAFVRSLTKIAAVDAGFDPDRLVAVRVQLPAGEYRGPEPKIEFFESLEQELGALPGVQSTGLIDALPIQSTTWTTGLSIEGLGEEGFVHDIQHRAPGPGYFATMGVEVVAGRDFRPGDEERPAVILNLTTVERYFQGLDPIGRQVKMARPSEEGTWYTVVGVVEDEKQDDLRADVVPQMYEPFRQDPDRAMTIVLRTSTDIEALADPIRDTVRSLDDAVLVRSVETMNGVLRGSLARERFLMTLLGAFAGTSLLLAAIGIYGVLAYWISRRNREMGIRQALGASSGSIARLVVGQSMGAIAGGALLGLALAAATGRSLRTVLYEVSPTEPSALALLSLAVLAVGLLASSLPVGRALRVDPQQALRDE